MQDNSHAIQLMEKLDVRNLIEKYRIFKCPIYQENLMGT